MNIIIKKTKYFIITVIMLMTVTVTYSLDLYAASVSKSNISPDTWTYVDGLGRTAEAFGQIGDLRGGHRRAVGIFYHTWHTDFHYNRVPVNIQKVIEEYPEAAIDVTKNKWWVKNIEKKFEPGYFWNEPLFGFYKTQDEYVLRKHAEMLADAGVDFIYIDGTNGRYMWEDGVEAILKVFAEARKDGVKAPQIVFWLSLSESANRIAQISLMYEKWYSDPKYDDLWFKWDGKPLVLSFTDILDSSISFENKEEIVNSFTFRAINPSYFNQGGREPSFWGWLSVYPQCRYGRTKDKNRPEQMAVGIAQNADSLTNQLTFMAAGDQVMGRSYAGLVNGANYSYSYKYGGKEYTADQRNEFATLAGRNFQQQWDYAIECDPDVILITGWNEWTAYRTSGFCDAFTDEYSRDIEPTKGKLKDHYYYQLVANIRRYKGASSVIYNGRDKATIDINSGDMSQWDEITPYEHYIRSTRDRNDRGYLTCEFENFTMRNDIVTSKVAYDKENFYFYVQTLNDLTPDTDKAWMRLFIDTDYSGNSANWEGFEYVINRINPSDGSCVLERSKGVSDDGTWLWEKVSSADDVKYTVTGNVLQIKVPRKLLGFASGKFDFSFKWSDNMQTDGDIMDFYSNGDVAPGGRFAFRFQNIEGGMSVSGYIIIICGILLMAAVILTCIFMNRKQYNKII